MGSVVPAKPALAPVINVETNFSMFSARLNLDLTIDREQETRQSMPDVAERSLRATGVYFIVNEDWEKRARPQMACYGASQRRFAP
jgi:hypothetical protein